MTNSWEKMVISSITQQLPIELSDDRNYAVTRTKHDPLLSSFNAFARGTLDILMQILMNIYPLNPF